MAALNSRSQTAENEADATAARALYHAGIDPRVLATFFERLREIYGDNAEAAFWMSTHPSHGDRIAAINNLAAQLESEHGNKEYQALEIDWPAVQAALEEAGAAGHNAALPHKESTDGSDIRFKPSFATVF